ncbi:hypothetical protein [Mycobacterium leprae]|nr:hypothetical protein [Mycobacterium leprae]
MKTELSNDLLAGAALFEHAATGVSRAAWPAADGLDEVTPPEIR